MDETQTPPITQPVSGTQSIGEIPVQPDQRDKKRRFLIPSAILALVILPLLIFGAWRLFGPKPDVLLATVGDQKIYKSDVIKAAEEQYVPKAVTNDVLKRFYDIVIERAILDQEAKNLGIVLTANQIKHRISQISPANSNLQNSLYTITKYDLLKQAVIKKKVISVSGYSVGFYIPPNDYPVQKPEYAMQRIDGEKALIEIEALFKNNQSATTIATAISNKYPSLQNMLSVNGYIWNKSPSNNLVREPKLFIISSFDKNSTVYNKETYETLLTIKPNEIKKILRVNGSGGLVLKAIAVKGEGFKNYKEFINKKESELKNTYQPL